MRSNPVLFISIILGILLLVDLYAFKGIKLLSSTLSQTWLRKSIYYAYWLASLFLYTGLVVIIANMSSGKTPTPGQFHFFSFLFGFMVLLFVPKLLFSIFHLIEDLSQLGIRTYKAFSSPKPAHPGEPISRLKFISQIGIILAAIPFLSILYGIFKGKYDFEIIKKKISFNNLPAAFHGLRIVQISDMHIGSFDNNREAVQKGIDLINSLNPDLVFFTGDLVNNYHHETTGWEEILLQIKAKHGKYSILGNHDYSDYVPWENVEEKKENLKNLIKFHETIEFRLLMNEHVPLHLNGEEIALIGVENWGKGGFAKYGDIKKAQAGAEQYPFKILLSHDPSHWDEKIVGKENIDLTLSGHTHGMQFGIRLGNFQYSPVQHKYKHWSGLYQLEDQYLHVNKGFGFLGFPGRVGMPPEITLIELFKA